jgi:tetratricopeptide (TPR) repeat protein
MLDPYVLGRYLLYRGTANSGRESAVHYRKVIEVDSGSARAYAELSNAHTLAFGSETIGPREAIPKVISASTRAIELDSQLATPYFGLMFIECLLDWNWARAEETVRHGIALNPHDALGQLSLSGLCAALGRHEEGLARMHEAVRLEPLSVFYSAFHGLVLYYAHRFEEAIQHLRQVIHVEPSFYMAQLWIGLSYTKLLLAEDALHHMHRAVEVSDRHPRMLAGLGYAQATLGQPLEARRVLDILRDLSERQYVSPVGIAAIEAALGEKDRAFESLETAFEERSHALIWLNVDARFSRLREEPRFQALLVRQRLVPSGHTQAP